MSQNSDDSGGWDLLNWKSIDSQTGSVLEKLFNTV